MTFKQTPKNCPDLVQSSYVYEKIKNTRKNQSSLRLETRILKFLKTNHIHSSPILIGPIKSRIFLILPQYQIYANL